MVCLAVINMLFGQLPNMELATFIVTGILILLLLPIARFVMRGLLRRTWWWGIRMLLIGTPADCEQVLTRSDSYRSSGFIITDSLSVPEGRAQADQHELMDLTNQAFSLGCAKRAPVVSLVSLGAQALSNRMMFQFPSVVLVDQPSSSEFDAEAADLLGLLSTHANMPLSRMAPRVLKRALDLAITIPALIVLAIPMSLIALAIKVRSRGPSFFGPERIGQNGRTFRSWKFRTMVPNAEQVLQRRLQSDPVARREWEQTVKLKNDPRVIPGIGNFLRDWSLDELPQLWNVLVGEMSLIGPRPIARYEIERYQKHYFDYTQMLPGITGLWQVSGRSETTYDTRVQMVHRYATKWSIWLDLWILAKTPVVVLTRRGAY